jgi:hypothetical protein
MKSAVKHAAEEKRGRKLIFKFAAWRRLCQPRRKLHTNAEFDPANYHGGAWLDKRPTEIFT